MSKNPLIVFEGIESSGKSTNLKKAIKYLTESDRDDGMPNDAVARFHVGNGASLERINLNADMSEKGLTQSYGIMANYLYDLDVVEENHEIFFAKIVVPISKEIKSFTN